MNRAVLGYEPVLVANLSSYVMQRNPEFDPQIAEAYADLSPMAGIRTAVAFSQAIHETGYFKFGRCGEDEFAGCPQFHNYCGLKTTDGRSIAHFANIEWGVRAHLGHLLWYFSPHHPVRDFCEFDTRHWSFSMLQPHHNKANDWSRLSGAWAPSTTYADRAFQHVEALLVGKR